MQPKKKRVPKTASADGPSWKPKNANSAKLKNALVKRLKLKHRKNVSRKKLPSAPLPKKQLPLQRLRPRVLRLVQSVTCLTSHCRLRHHARQIANVIVTLVTVAKTMRAVPAS